MRCGAELPPFISIVQYPGRPVILGMEKKHINININKFAGLSRDWVGAKILFMCFVRVVPYGGEKNINKVPPRIPGQPRESFVYVFLSLCVSSLPRGFHEFMFFPDGPYFFKQNAP